MKKFYSLLVAAAMVMGATSCQKDAAETVATNEPVSFTATLNNTRTELGEGNKVMWNADDKITIYTQENTAGVVFDGDATEAAATATFTTTSEFTPSATGYLAVYPELKWNTPTYPPTGVVPAASYADGVWSVPVHIGVEQDVVTDGWDEKYNYMVAYSQDNKLAFQAATALIKFTYTGTQDGIVTLTAEGANLAGNATLNYNTADGSISYTTTGTTTEISLFGCVTGETYFIPVFPGKVTNFAVTGLSTSYAPETYIGYDGEFEFKAGKIYKAAASDVPQVIPSPYVLVTGDMANQSQMVIEEGYHVAKGVSFCESGYCFFDGMNAYTATKEITLNEWQATKNGWTEDFMALVPFASNWDLADIYLSEDASMMCVVPAGAEVPAMPEPFVPEQTLWAISGELNNWGDTFLYTTETEGLLVAQNVTFETDYSEFKFRYDSNWDQQYTSEVYGIEANKWVVADNTTSLGNTSVLTAGTYDVYLDTTNNNNKIYVVTAGSAIEDAVEQTVSNQKPVESAGKLYLIPNANWKIDNARFAAYFFGNGEHWLDMTDADSDGCYECEIPEGYPNVIFCRMNPNTTTNNWNNKWNQTADLTVPTDGTNCYTVTEGTWDKGGGTWSTK
ncbi:MAG: hypothetical protein IJB62_09015 [Alistipes sp.]|nr:hypothetical protein [Alistipes sp.]